MPVVARQGLKFYWKLISAPNFPASGDQVYFLKYLVL